MINVTRSNLLRTAASLLLVLPIAISTACSVHVDKSADGHDKNVNVDTPLGGVHVNTDTAAAANTGIALYPGAKVEPDKDGDKAADVHLGFGPWQLRVKVVNYSTPDPQEKVLNFYRKQLGDGVIECRGNEAVGHPARTPEGLTCSDSKGGSVHTDRSDFMLKAGSKRRQRMVTFEHPPEHAEAGPTKFAVIALELPADMDKHDKNRETD